MTVPSGGASKRLDRFGPAITCDGDHRTWPNHTTANFMISTIDITQRIRISIANAAKRRRQILMLGLETENERLVRVVTE